MLSREERVLTQLLLARRMATPEEVEALISHRLSGGPSIAESLAARGVLSAEDCHSLEREANAITAALSTEPPTQGALDGFRLVREIGRGGMGVVFEAMQESLGRRVAVKVLPPGLALDERSASRFLREGRAVARLNHPGIVPIYGSGQSQGALYFAMELIDGPSLDKRIAEGPLDAREAASIAAQMARALQHAHDSGLIHRDVKPANVLLDARGIARLTDFGLVHDAEADPLTISSAMIGTPAYMAPEQARGESTTAAVDVYGVGAVLYTMLAGRAPYDAGSNGSAFTQVLTAPPRPLGEVDPALPRALVAICEQAMARRPSERYPTVGALAEDLDRWLAGEAVQAQPPPPEVVPRGRHSLSYVTIAIALVALVALAVASMWGRSGPRLIDGKLTQLTRLPGREVFPSLSRDAQRLVFGSDLAGNWDVFLQDLAPESEPINLTADSPDYDGEAAVSPNGRRVVFRSDRQGGGLFLLDVASKGVRQLTNFGGNPVWSLDGQRIAFSSITAYGPSAGPTASELWVVDTDNGAPRRVPCEGAQQPSWSPDGQRLVYWLASKEQFDLFTIPVGGGTPTRITDGRNIVWNPVWSPDGEYIYFVSDRNGPMNVWRLPVDSRSGAAQGEPAPVTRGTDSGNYYVTVSADGASIAFVSRLHREDLYAVAFDPQAGTVVGRPRLFTRQTELSASLSTSPDGKQIVMAGESGSSGIAVLDAAGKLTHWLTRDASRNRAPRWSPSGDRIVFYSDRGGKMEIWTARPDGSDLTRIALPSIASAIFPVWSPDATRLALTDEKRGAAIVQLADGSVEALPALSDSAEPFEPWSWSERGAHGASIAGTARGIVLFDPQRGEYRRLTTSGERPVWLPDGRRLVYSDAGRLWLIDTDGGAPREVYSAGAQKLAATFALSADATTLFFSQKFSEGDVWMLRAR